MYNLRLLALHATGRQSVSKVTGAPASYGVSAPLATKYQDTFDNFAAAVAEAEAAKAAWHAAVANQSAAKARFLETVSEVGIVVYNNPAVTEAMLIDAGFPPHETIRSVATPTTPSEFRAEPFANGTVKLKWDRNGSPKGTSYIIEIQTPSESKWTVAYVTTKTKHTLAGFAPGVPVNFRLVAQKGDHFAYPSAMQTIYSGPIAVPAFRHAA